MPWIGDIYIPHVTDQGNAQSRETAQFKGVGESWSVSEFTDRLKNGDLEYVLTKDGHPNDVDLDEQFSAVKSLLERDTAENPFAFLKERGHLSITSVDTGREPRDNVRSGTLTVRYLPDSIYQPTLTTSHEDVSNDFGISFYGTVFLPKVAENVRLRSGRTGDSVPLDPVTTRVDESGNRQNYMIPTEQGGIHAYSSDLFVNGPNFDNSSGTGPTYQNDGYGLQSATLGSGHSADHTFTVPDGQYDVVVRAESTSTSHSLTVEGTTHSFDTANQWQVKTTKGVTVSNSSITVNLSSDGSSIHVDYIFLVPKNKPQIIFDYPTDDVFDMDASGFWRFDEGSGATAYDSSPNGFDISLSGPSWTSDSKTNEQALTFDGSSDYGEIKNNPNIHLGESGGITYGCWFKVSSVSSHGMLLDYRSSNSIDNYSGYSVRMDSDGSIRAVIRDQSGNETNINTSSSYDDGSWHLVLVTVNYNGDSVIYVDDSEDIRGANSFTDIVKSETDNPLFGKNGNNDLYYSGIMDSPVIYPYVISSNQRTHLYENPGAALNPLASYNVASGQGVRVYDTNGSINESNWTRVYNESHNYNGTPVIEDGQHRLVMNDPGDNDTIHLYVWDGTQYSNGGQIRWQGKINDSMARASNISVDSISPSAVELSFEVDGEPQELTFQKGKNINIIGKSSKSEIYLDPRVSVSGVNNLGQFEEGFTPPNHVGDRSIGSEPIVSSINSYMLAYNIGSNHVATLTTSDDAISFDLNIKFGEFGILTPNADYTFNINIGYINFDSTANLFSEAENANLSNGGVLDHWEMPLTVSGNLHEFSGNTANFFEDTTNGLITHSDDNWHFLTLNALQWGQSQSSNHYHWSAQASDTTDSEEIRSRYAVQDPTITYPDRYLTRLSFTNNTIELGKQTNDSFSTLASASMTLSYGTTYHCEVEWDPSNGSHDMYVWADGNSKPSSPTLSTTDSDHVSGQVGILAYGSVDLHSWSVDAEETTSSQNSAVILPSDAITGTNARVEYTINESDIEPGTYIVAARGKRTNTNASQLDLRNKNTTDNSAIQLDSDASINSGSYKFYTNAITIDADDVGDSIQSRVISYDSNDVDHGAIDEFIIFPISLLQGGNQLGPQDVAYQALADPNSDEELIQRQEK
ncbi:MAG: LamG-like jellyroll fold domain-containing protein [Halopenitus sp.]